MTKLALVTFKCTRCGALFWSYFEVVDDNDKKWLENAMRREASFSDFIIRGQRECRKCRKGIDITGFMDLQEDFGIPSK